MRKTNELQPEKVGGRGSVEGSYQKHPTPAMAISLGFHGPCSSTKHSSKTTRLATLLSLRQLGSSGSWVWQPEIPVVSTSKRQALQRALQNYPTARVACSPGSLVRLLRFSFWWRHLPVACPWVRQLCIVGVQFLVEALTSCMPLGKAVKQRVL